MMPCVSFVLTPWIDNGWMGLQQRRLLQVKCGARSRLPSPKELPAWGTRASANRLWKNALRLVKITTDLALLSPTHLFVAFFHSFIFIFIFVFVISSFFTSLFQAQQDIKNDKKMLLNLWKFVNFSFMDCLFFFGFFFVWRNWMMWNEERKKVCVLIETRLRFRHRVNRHMIVCQVRLSATQIWPSVMETSTACIIRKSNRIAVQ